jgi:hypothetical protein
MPALSKTPVVTPSQPETRVLVESPVTLLVIAAATEVAWRPTQCRILRRDHIVAPGVAALRLPLPEPVLQVMGTLIE